MRKRSIKLIFEKLMWGIIMFLPIIGFIGTMYGNMARAYNQNIETTELQTSYENGIYFISSFDIYMTNQIQNTSLKYGSGDPGEYRNTSIYNILNTIRNYITFNEQNIQDTAIGEGVILWIMYIIIVEILHLTADVLLFIPRWCHHVMNNFLNKTEGACE